jgi:hypothetical protein
MDQAENTHPQYLAAMVNITNRLKLGFEALTKGGLDLAETSIWANRGPWPHIVKAIAAHTRKSSV